MFEELLKRSECRIACRRLGIIEVRKSGNHVLLLSLAIDGTKWDGLKRSIPEVNYYTAYFFVFHYTSFCHYSFVFPAHGLFVHH